MADSPNNESCLWCTESSFVQSYLYEFFEQFGSKSKRCPTLPWLKQAKRDLCICCDCMEEYHRLVESALNRDPKFLESGKLQMKEIVYWSDVSRLEDYLQATLEGVGSVGKESGFIGAEEGDEEDISSFLQSQSAAELLSCLECPLRELMKYPRLLLNESLSELLVGVFKALQDADQSLEINERLPGVYLLLVHPDYEIRRWAVTTVKSLGPLDWDEYDELEEVVNWVMNALTFNMFLDPVTDVGDAAWNEDVCVQLPKHLFVHNSPKDFWLGICMLITAMDANCVRMRLMSTVGGHRDLIDSIVEALKYGADKNYSSHHRKKVSDDMKMTTERANAAIFWPAMQCLATLLGQLESRFWQFASRDAESVLESVLSNPYFHFELKRWALNGKEEDGYSSSEMESEVSISEDDWIMSNSQLVYKWDGEAPSASNRLPRQTEFESPEISVTQGRNSAGKLHTAVFSWAVPFVQSLLDFGIMMNGTIGSVFTALHSIFTKSIAGDKDFEYFNINTSPSKEPISLSVSKLVDSIICNESLLTLSRLVELLFAKDGFIFLLQLQNRWLPLITETISMLLCSSQCATTDSSGMQYGLNPLKGQSLPSSISHVVSLCINMLNSAEAKRLPKSSNFLSALSAFSPKVRAPIPVQTNTRLLHRKSSVKGSAAPRAQELSQHFLAILRKCHENQGSFSLFDSLCQNSSPSNTPSQRLPSETDHEKPLIDDMEVCEEVPSSVVAPQEQSTDKECPRDTTAFHSPTIESDVEEPDMELTPIQNDQGKTVSGGSMPSFTVKAEPVCSLKKHDSSDSEIAVTPLARKRRRRSSPLKAQRGGLMDSSDDMDDFEPSLSMSQISRTKPLTKRRPRQKLLDSLSEGTTEELSSGEPCKLRPLLPGSAKRPSTVTTKNLVAPPSTSSVSKVPGTSETCIKAKRQSTHSISTSCAKSSAKSISTVEPKEAKSCLHSSPITTRKQKVKLEHQKSPPFRLHLDSDVSDPESSTSSISLSSSVHSESGESSNLDSELPSFTTMMERFAKNDKGGLPIKKAKSFKEVLPDCTVKYKTSSAKKPKTKKSNERHRGRGQKLERVRTAKLTPKKKRTRLLPSPSTDSLGDEDEIVVISSADSSTTEPLSPAVPQCQYPSQSSDISKIKQKVVNTERPLSQQIKQDVKASSKVVSRVKMPSPSEATEWFDKDDLTSTIHGIDEVTSWVKSFMEGDKMDLTCVQTPESPGVVNLMDDLSGQVSGKTRTHCMGSNYSGSSSECETAIQLAAAQYAEHGSTIRKTPGRDMTSLKTRQTKGAGAASVPPTTVQSTAAPPCYSELQYPAPSCKNTNSHPSSRPMLKLKEFSLNVVRLDRNSIKRINQRIAKSYEQRHPHSNLIKTHSNVDRKALKTSLQKKRKHRVCELHSAPTLTVSVDLSLISSPESPIGITESWNLHRATADSGRQKECTSWKPDVSKALRQDTRVRENVELKLNPSSGLKTLESGGQKLQKFQNRSTKEDEDECHTPSVLAGTKQSLMQLKSPTEDETTSTAIVPCKPQALKKLDSLDVTATTTSTLAPYQAQPLPLDNSEFSAATTTLPMKSRALLLEKPASEHVQKTVPPVKPPNVPHTTLPTESSMMRPPSTRRTAGKSQGGARVSHSRPIKHVSVNTKPKTLRKMDQFYCEVLSWDPTRFMFPQETPDGQIMRPYPVLTENPVPIPEVFESYERYCSVFSPLLLLELWEDVFQNVQDQSALKPPPCSAQIESITAMSTPNLQLLKCKAFVSLDQARQYAHPVERDLVIVDFRDAFESRGFIEMGNTGYFPNFQYRFGVVESVNRLFSHPTSLNQGSGPQPSDKNTSTSVTATTISGAELTLNLKVFGMHFASMFSLENQGVQLNVVTSLTTALRQWNGLINIHASQLVRDILYPRGGAYFGLSRKQMNRDSTFTLNPSMYNEFQIEAIQSVVEAVQESYALPRICLLQGPPGTGKTRTISGLIRAIFQSLPPQQSKGPALPGQQLRQVQQARKPHILVCAPSNGGVDEIARRLIKEGQVTGIPQCKEKHGSTTTRGDENQNPDKPREGGLRVVRVGQQQKIHPDILPISLDELAKKNLAKDTNNLQSFSADKLKKQISELEQKIEKLEREHTVLSRAEKREEVIQKMKALDDRVAQHQEERNRLHQQHREAKMKQRNSKREQSLIRKRILLNADIICATLCGSGSVALMECVQNNPLHFTCVVVDEAAQCNELDVLVPLRYLSSKLVLVGDPLQLPATIKSQKALSLGFGQSLFERLYKHFSRLDHSENPVKMLRVQYRMLPEICQFPSDHFYHGRLKTSRSMQLAGAGFKFQPFLMFDVVRGREIYNDSRSVYNKEECEMVIAICQLLLDSEVVPSAVGIITPYKAQERVISGELLKRCNCQSIEVGTVDGFQGREKDIIILSCVRAKGDRGIGFLSNRQRMNVALTRCKRALYIVGHLGSLTVNKDWLDLIRHADKCHAIIRAIDSYKATAEYVRKKGSGSNLLTSSSQSGSTEIGQKKRPLDASATTTDVQEHASHIKKMRLGSETSQPHLAGSDHCSSSSGSNCLPTFSLTRPIVGVVPPTRPIAAVVPPTRPIAAEVPPTRPIAAEVPPTRPIAAEVHPTRPIAAEVLRHTHHNRKLPAVATTEELDCNAYNPSPPVSAPPKSEREWRLHGGPRSRVAHQDAESIQKRRNIMAASSKWPEPPQTRTDKKKKNIREILSSTMQ